jgi:hypothetical protein
MMDEGRDIIAVVEINLLPRVPLHFELPALTSTIQERRDCTIDVRDSAVLAELPTPLDNIGEGLKSMPNSIRYAVVGMPDRYILCGCSRQSL